MTIANIALEGETTVPIFDAEAVLRVIESARQVRRRYQFFVWSHSYLRTLVPFDVCVCGAYQRASKGMVFEVFHSQPLAPALLATLSDGGSTLMHQVIGSWMEQRGNAAIVDVRRFGGASAAAHRTPLLDAGLDHLLVHGVSRPQRLAEIESLFLFGSFDKGWTEQHRDNLELVLPQLHATYLRVLAAERELARGTSGAAVPRSADVQALITHRERQILVWVREGKSNQEIGEQLTISALTVKNHVQKILRKLGAANRAQAVAKAMTLNLLERSAPFSSPFGSVDPDSDS